MQVTVRDNDVMRAFRKLKKKLHDEGVVQELMDRRYYTKRSDAKRKKHQDAVRRRRKDAAKKAAKDFK